MGRMHTAHATMTLWPIFRSHIFILSHFECICAWYLCSALLDKHISGHFRMGIGVYSTTGWTVEHYFYMDVLFDRDAIESEWE